MDTEGTRVTGRNVQVQVFRREWHSVREQREDGGFYWRSTPEDQAVWSGLAQTNARGEAEIGFVPAQGGQYRIVGHYQDAAGRDVRSATTLWVYGDGAYIGWARQNDRRVELISDKDRYSPGETAKILVASPFAKSEALITIERGEIMQVERRTFDGNASVIELPIEQAHLPNIFVSVTLIQADAAAESIPSFKQGYLMLPVATDEKRLDIEIRKLSLEGDGRKQARPGETVAWQVEVLDFAGRPQKAELSLALVDEALLALLPPREDGLHTDFYSRRALGVKNANSLVHNADAFVEKLWAETKGGGGGSIDGEPRAVFKDTAFWQASLVTGEDGKAVFTTPLPDNLTTWRLIAKAITAQDTLVGEASETVMSTRELIVRPILPRFAVAGDELQIGAEIRNNSSGAEQFEVTLHAPGLQLDESSSEVRSLFVEEGGSRRVYWRAGIAAQQLEHSEVFEALGEMSIVMGAVGQSEAGRKISDAVEHKIPVYAYTAKEVTGTAGQVDAERLERVLLPAGIATHQGDLKIELSPSLAAASTESLRWLKSYPYECAEQTTSKFLPNVATLHMLESLNLAKPTLRSDLEPMVQQQIQRLYALQKPSGGWGWWERSTENPWLSAYALYGLHIAKASNIAVDNGVMRRAEEFVSEALSAQSTDDSTRAFMLFVLSEINPTKPLLSNRALAIFSRREGLDLETKAFLAMTLDSLSQSRSEIKTEPQTLISEIAGAAEISATGTHWEEYGGRYAYNRLGSEIRSNAVIIQAISRIDPEHLMLSNAIRHLMQVREKGRWGTTIETVWSVLGLNAFMQASGEMAGRSDYSLSLDGESLIASRFTEHSVLSPVNIKLSISDLLADQTGASSLPAYLAQDTERDLRFNRSGTGKLYYSAHLRLHRPASKALPVDRGIRVTRRYLEVDPLSYQATGQEITEVRVGDVVKVQLGIDSDQTLHHVLLEDHLPAGFEALNADLETVSTLVGEPRLSKVDEHGLPWWRRGWWFAWDQSQIFDDRVALFSEYMAKGQYSYSYLMRASLAGSFEVIPAHAEQMYMPEVFGRSAGRRILVGTAER